MSDIKWALEKVVFGEFIHLAEGLTKIGRSAACEIRITSDFVSRNHAEFQVESEHNGVQIRDLGSTNGVFVNDVHYTRETCRLSEGDRIGIGVYVDDHTVSEHPDGKYPMYFLRCLREEQPQTTNDNEKVNEKSNDEQQPNEIPQSVVPQMVEAVVKAPSPEQPENESDDEDVVMDETDSEYDDINEKENFILPKARISSDVNKPTPQETAPVTTTSDNKAQSIITANIQSIFGDLNPVLNNLSKNAREIAEASSSLAKPLKDKDDIICISSDEECEIDERQKNAKSPQLFGDSFNSEGDNVDAEKENEKQAHQVINQPENFSIVQALPLNAPVSAHLEIKPEPINPPEMATTSNDSDENDKAVDLAKKEFEREEEDDLFFTQKIFEDMKDELPDFDEDEEPKIDQELPLAADSIKKEISTPDLDGTIICLDDDDEFDEEFESKVNKWSFMLSSQSFSSFNKSQVYEDETDDEYMPTSKDTYLPDTQDEFIDNNNQDRNVEVDGNDKRAERLISISTPSPEKEREPIKAQQNLMKELFSSTSSSDDDRSKEPITSSSRRQEKVTRKLSTIEEAPTKKRRIEGKSEDDENERRKSSSTLKTYSRKSSTSKNKTSASLTVKDSSSHVDIFDKLKEDYKTKSSSHTKPLERSKSRDESNLYRRTNSAAATDEPSVRTYKSATIARRMSVGSHNFNDQNEAMEDFVLIEKPEVVAIEKSKVVETTMSSKVLEEQKKTRPEDITIPVKTIRGPPEIIQPPSLPVHKGKLRGVSAHQVRVIESIKAAAIQTELKRKWLEKPSIAAKKEKEKKKSIKEDRKQKLKELADKKKSENAENNNKTKAKTTQSENETSKKKLKVKVTSVNRGAFLIEDAPSNKKTNFKIPKKTHKPNEPEDKPEEPPKPSTSKASLPVPTTKPCTNSLKTSTEVTTGFGMELAKADMQIEKAAFRNRQKSTDSSSEQRQRAPPRRNSKKLNFNDVNHLYDENERLRNIFDESERLKNKTKKSTKKVRFNDEVQIFYIESIKSANRKPYQAESPVFALRKNAIRRQYPIVDHSEVLLSEFLRWSQQWLDNKQIAINLTIFPMASQFQSFDIYKSIIFPLLKLEHLGHLEKYMEQHASRPGFIADIDYHTQNRERDILFAKCNSPIKQSDLGAHDLALFDVSLGVLKSQYFGYITNIRRSGTCNVITIEICHNISNKNIFNAKPRIRIRRIIEGILLHLSTFNAIHQLEKTPLIKKILNPLELLSVAPNNCISSDIEYKGIDTLNTEQLDILLKTYERAIDQSNPNISLINGPPGTGKSVLITNLAIQLLYGDEVHQLDKKILICAQSNMAVDVIAEKLIKIKGSLSSETPKFDIIRFGNDEKIHPNVKDISLKSLLQRHRASAIRMNNPCNDQTANGENLKIEILQLEARIAELERNTFQDVRQDELIEMRKNLTLKKNIVNQSLRPEDERKLKTWLLEKANIVCVTLSSCVKLSNFIDYFDICIIDEATQCTEPWTIMPLKFGISNLIMVGDTQQLPATVISQKAKDLGLGTSLFTRIQNCLENKYRDKPSPVLTPQRPKEEFKPIFTLREQYRMHSEISKWPNMYFYKNLLKNSPKTDEFKCSIRPFSILNLDYIQNDSNNGQISNSLEADFVTKLIMVLDDYIPNKFFSYGVITPYAHHREKLEGMIRNRGLQDVMVNTIDSYQGLEKDVIIISNARTRGVGFLANYQRLNVALTRPKKCLILCGNFKNLESVPSWSSLLANAKERGLYHQISTKDALDITKNVIEKIKIKR